MEEADFETRIAGIPPISPELWRQDASRRIDRAGSSVGQATSSGFGSLRVDCGEALPLLSRPPSMTAIRSARRATQLSWVTTTRVRPRARFPRSLGRSGWG